MSPTPAQQVADVISALASVAWPVSIVVLLIVFRAPIKRLIGDTKRLRTAGVEVEFQEHTQEVLNELSDSGLKLESLEPAEQRLLGELSKTNPRLAINLAWSRVRDTSSRAAAAVGISSQVTVRRIERLRQKGFATDDIVDLARTLKAMESAVTSKPDIDPPRDFADAFTAAALSLSRWLEDTTRSIRSGAISPYLPGVYDYGSPPYDYGSPPYQYGPSPYDYGSPPYQYGSPPYDSPPYQYGSPPRDNEPSYPPGDLDAEKPDSTADREQPANDDGEAVSLELAQGRSEVATVTIGIHVHAEPYRLLGTLDALKTALPPGADVILLPDGADSETSAALSRMPCLREIPQWATDAPCGPPACFNRLIRGTRTDVVILLENGARPAPDALTRLIATLDTSFAGLAGPSTNIAWNEQAMLPNASSTASGLVAAAAEARRRYGDSIRLLTPLYSLADFCFAVRRDVVEIVGAADEEFGLGPCWEMEYNVRAARAGFAGVWVCAAFVHRAPFTLRRRIEESRRFDANRRLYQDRLCGQRLDGIADHYQDHCRGDGCPHFAPAHKIRIQLPLGTRPIPQITPRSVACIGPDDATRWAPGRVSGPVVSCVMPTADRPEFVGQAIHYLRRQDYIDWELVVIDDGAIDTRATFFREFHDSRITWVRLSHAVSIGQKRNIGCERAHGGFIAHWDDDDWHGRGRLRRQLAPLLAGYATITALRDAPWFDVGSWRFLVPSRSLHRRLFTADVVGGTLVYHRSILRRSQYPNCSIAEDSIFLKSALQNGHKLIGLPADGLYVYVRHGANTWRTSKWVGSDARDWRQIAEPDYLAEDREFYGRFPKTAPMTGPAPHIGPLISCLMPTADRRNFLPSAISCFLDQTYRARELVVVDDGDEAIEDLVTGRPDVRYVRLAHRTVLGEKRNIAAEIARGELLAHWDDDDWSHPERLARQVAALASSVDACGLSELLWWEPANQRAWRYRYAGHRPWVAGNTLAYRKDAWLRSPFPALPVGEDTAFLWGPGQLSIQPLKDMSLVVGTIHEHNSCPKFTQGDSWTRAPVDDVRRIMGKPDTGRAAQD